MRGAGRWSGLLLVFVLLPVAAAAEGRRLALTAGVFNLSKRPTQIEAGIELRQPLGRWGLEAAGGLAATEEGSLWIWGGAQRPLDVAPRWWLVPGFAVALYEEGDGKDLGGAVQFRTSLELAYEFANRSRLGVALYHLSNAGIDDLNPGSNSAVVVFSLPL